MTALVTVAEVKAHLRKGSDTSEDALVATIRLGAIAYVENYTGHLLTPRVVTDYFAAWGDFLTLRRQPITVGDPTPTLVVEYLDAEGDETEYGARVIRDQRYPWTIHPPYGDEFPTIADNSTITVTYTAGYASGEVPDDLNSAVLLMAGHLYTNRSAVDQEPQQEVPLGVVSLCRPFRGAVMA